jgi:hypothetical protein
VGRDLADDPADLTVTPLERLDRLLTRGHGSTTPFRSGR